MIFHEERDTEDRLWPPVPETPAVVLVDLLHTAEHPFCTDYDCLCHADPELLADVGDLLARHIITDEQAAKIIYGEMDLPQAA